MDNYVAVVFDNDAEAFEGLHKLWALDSDGFITMHGAGVVHRDSYGEIHVASKQTNPGLRTAVGVGIGALLGALAGPVGVAAGIAGAGSIVAGTAAGVGAAAGGVAGLTADAVKSGEHEQAAFESGFALENGQSAVVAEISEDDVAAVDGAMERLGGEIFRRPKSAVLSDSFSDDYYADYLYPYDYEPYFN